jgi:hypothetical protein
MDVFPSVGYFHHNCGGSFFLLDMPHKIKSEGRFHNQQTNACTRSGALGMSYYAMDLNLAKEVLHMRKMPDNRFQTFLLTRQATNNPYCNTNSKVA